MRNTSSCKNYGHSFSPARGGVFKRITLLCVCLLATDIATRAYAQTKPRSRDGEEKAHPADASTKSDVRKISPKSERGLSLGAMREGTVLRLQYVSGKWKSWGRIPTACPDDPMDRGGDDRAGAVRNRLAIVNAPAGGQVEMLSLVPPNTVEKPFEFVAPRDLENVALRINDSDGNWANPDGHVKYRVTIITQAMSRNATATSNRPAQTTSVAPATPQAAPIPPAAGAVDIRQLKPEDWVQGLPEQAQSRYFEIRSSLRGSERVEAFRLWISQWKQYLRDPNLTLIEFDYIQLNIDNRSSALYTKPYTKSDILAAKREYPTRISVLDSMDNLLRGIRTRATKHPELLKMMGQYTEALAEERVRLIEINAKLR